LLESVTQGPGGFEIQSDDQVARLTWPVVGRMLADAFDMDEAALAEFGAKLGMASRVLAG
jgi:hypothetical protein